VAGLFLVDSQSSTFRTVASATCERIITRFSFRPRPAGFQEDAQTCSRPSAADAEVCDVPRQSGRGQHGQFPSRRPLHVADPMRSSTAPRSIRPELTAAGQKLERRTQPGQGTTKPGRRIVVTEERATNLSQPR